MRAVLDLVFPRSCVGCGRSGSDACGACRAQLQTGVRPGGTGLPEVRYAGVYDGWLRDTVVAYKAGDESLVHALAEVLRGVVPTGGLLVPVPSSASKIRARGFDTISGVVERTGAPWLAALRLTREPRDQVGLSATARRANVRGAFVAATLLTGEVWLVDDVVTTGSTLAEAARAVTLAGADRVRAVALCSAQR